MPKFKYSITLDQKRKGNPDTDFVRSTLCLKFPYLSELFVKGASNQYKEEGIYNVIDLTTNPSSSSQEIYDTRQYLDFLMLQNGAFAVFEAENSQVFDKLRIKWLSCGCAESQVYRVQFTLVEEIPN